jgi:hypothetical protein
VRGLPVLHRETCVRASSCAFASVTAVVAALSFAATSAWAAPKTVQPIVSIPLLNKAHFHCYVVVQPPVPSTPPVSLRDQFQTLKNVEVGPPVMLCAPVQKNGEPTPDMKTHLVCYALEPTNSAGKIVLVTNQFGARQLQVGTSRMLCVPSTKKVISDAPTTAPTAAAACPQNTTTQHDRVGLLNCACNYPKVPNPQLITDWYPDCVPALMCMGAQPGAAFGNSICLPPPVPNK